VLRILIALWIFNILGRRIRICINVKSRIRIRTKVKSRIRLLVPYVPGTVRIKVKSREPWRLNGAIEASKKNIQASGEEPPARKREQPALQKYIS
jgi:hypothetical protein